MAAGQKPAFAAELTAGLAGGRNIWQRDNPVEFAKQVADILFSPDGILCVIERRWGFINFV